MMMKAARFGALLLLASFTFAAHAAAPTPGTTDDRRVSLALKDAELSAQNRVTETLSLLDVVTNQLLTPSLLEVSHEKLLHLFVFDEALQEFQHVHPELIEGTTSWKVELSLPRDGKYQVWAQGTIAADHTDFIAEWPLEVYNGLPANSVPSELGDHRVGVDGTSRVTASSDRITAGKMVMLNLRMDRVDGSEPALAPYLGAPAHVVAVPLHGQDLVHVHPMAGAQPNLMMLHALFPAAGDYRLWIQFLDGGALRVVPLSVRVLPKS